MRRFLRIALATFTGAALPALAEAQYLYRLNVSSIGATVCSTTVAQTAINGDYDWILPPTSNNVRIVRFVNGAQVAVTFESQSPFNVDNLVSGGVIAVLPAATPLPYTVSVETMPFSNGATVGTGHVATWNCDAAGGGTFSVVDLAAPVFVAVPATSAPALAGLATLLALAGLARARRRALLRRRT